VKLLQNDQLSKLNEDRKAQPGKYAHGLKSRSTQKRTGQHVIN